MFYRSSWWNKELNAVVVNKNPYRKPHNYLTGFMTADQPIVAFDGTRDAFVGLYNTLKDLITQRRESSLSTKMIQMFENFKSMQMTVVDIVC